MNSYTDLEKLELYAQQIHDSGIDITPDQKNEWTMIAYACASQGEAGREPYHLICSNYPGYSREECDRHFSYCLKTSKNCVGLGSLVKTAKDHGLELKLPKGRRRKTPEQREEEQKNKFERMMDKQPVAGQPGQDGLFASSVFDSTTGEVIVKVVNTSDVTQVISLNLQGVKDATEAQTITLHSDVMDAENTLDRPDLIIPVQGSIDVTAGKKASTIVDELGPKTFRIYKIKK